jgi:hypothetical protein
LERGGDAAFVLLHFAPCPTGEVYHVDLMALWQLSSTPLLPLSIHSALKVDAKDDTALGWLPKWLVEAMHVK